MSGSRSKKSDGKYDDPKAEKSKKADKAAKYVPRGSTAKDIRKQKEKQMQEIDKYFNR